MRALGKGSIASLIRTGLTVGWYALWCGAAGLVLGVIAYAAVAALILSGAIDNVLTGAAAWPIAVPALLAGAVFITAGFVIVGRLRKLFTNFSSGEPFARENAQHLRAIWIAMLALEIARYLLLALASVLITRFGGDLAERVDLNVSISLSTWASILILIVLAEVFREGARLREDQELTI